MQFSQLEYQVKTVLHKYLSVLVYEVLRGGEEADGVTTLSAESTPNSQGEPPRGGTGTLCIHDTNTPRPS